jgi:hypothetical protein
MKELIRVERHENGKRRRLGTNIEEKTDEDSSEESTPFSVLMLDALVHVLHFLPLCDLENFAIASSQCAEARNHVALDQTRTGTIVLRQESLHNQACSGRRGAALWNATMFVQEVEARRWNDVFQGRRTRLRIMGLDAIKSSKMTDIARVSRRVKLKNVTSLDASFSPSLDHHFRKVKNSVGKALAYMLPNLKELDISSMKVTETAVDAFAKHCPNLEVFRWNGSDGGLHLTGKNLTKCNNLKEVYLDDSRLYCRIRQFADHPIFLYDRESINFYSDSIHVFRFCSSKLERASLKGCKWYSWDLTASSPLDRGLDAEIPQEALMRFVQKTPTLKWFRSDLSKENVELLQEAYPGITFC